MRWGAGAAGPASKEPDPEADGPDGTFHDAMVENDDPQEPARDPDEAGSKRGVSTKPAPDAEWLSPDPTRALPSSPSGQVRIFSFMKPPAPRTEVKKPSLFAAVQANVQAWIAKLVPTTPISKQRDTAGEVCKEQLEAPSPPRTSVEDKTTPWPALSLSGSPQCQPVADR
ncbi:hypothetical protein KEM55_002288 [Ascosphaera atra]|nr:hypothetical protein KEM55_002288 [Ascosphaera atra]